MSGAVISRSRKVHQCTLSPDVRCGVNNNRTSHAVKLRKENVERNIKTDDGYYDDLCGNCFENLKITRDVIKHLDPRGGMMSSLASVTSHPSRDKAVQNMAVQASNNERDFTSHLDGSGSLKIVNRELLNQVKARNQRIMDLENKV